MARVLYGGDVREKDLWARGLRERMPDIDLVLDPDGADPASIDILLYEATGPIRDLSVFRGVAAIQSLWAGVEALLANPTLPDGPEILRMAEDGLTIGMTDYVVGHVMRLHLGMDAHRRAQAEGRWEAVNPPLSSSRRVGIVGLGVLGRDAAQKLAALRFDVAGWSRSQKEIEGVHCLCGAEGIETLLRRSDILVLLAPLTKETENLIDADAISQMPEGAHIINVARGPLVDDSALLAALDSGHLASATLDVFRKEPLPQENPYWRHPSVTVTPHIASVTRPESAACLIIEQIERFDSGRAFLHKVNRERGY